MPNTNLKFFMLADNYFSRCTFIRKSLAAVNNSAKQFEPYHEVLTRNAVINLFSELKEVYQTFQLQVNLKQGYPLDGSIIR